MTSTFSLPFPLNRPEYVASPELFISALAARLYSAESITSGGSRAVGIFFDGPTPNSKSLTFATTRPVGDQVAAFAAALQASGVTPEGDPIELAEGTLNSILGIRVERSQVQPTSPLSPSIAMLQNARGLLRKENPADIGKIIETMFSLGAQRDTKFTTAARRWQLASERRMEIDPLLRALDAAIDQSLLGSKQAVPSEAPDSDLPEGFGDTPFSWFATAWSRITDPEWVEALPARVWVDWATTILRLGYGFGFLWESAWYVALARGLQGSTSPSWEHLKSETREVVPWVSSRAGITARDVAPRLVRRIRQSERVRKELISYSKATSPVADFETLSREMHQDDILRERMLSAIRSTQSEGSATNLWEAIKYPLLSRETALENPDYYGVFRSSGRYLTVSPGTEWVAVIASLACEIPGGSTDVGTVIDSLGELGMRPDLGDLVVLLERAGLARGSADADRGVLVESAF